MLRLVCLMLVVSLCWVATGCWDQDEITALAVISGIGIDVGSGPNLLKLSLQTSPPTGSSPGGGGATAGGKLRVVSVESQTIAEGISELQARLRRQPFLLHLQFIVIGEELARSGIGGAVAGLQAAIQIRGSVPVFVTYGLAEQVLRAHSGIGRTPGEDISDLLQGIASAPIGHRVTVNSLVNTLQAKGKELSISILDLAPLELSSSGEAPDDGVGQGGEEFTEVVIARTALFQRDRWVETLDRFETSILVMLLGTGGRGVLAITNPADEQQTMAVHYENLRVKYELAVNGSAPPQVVLKLEGITRMLAVRGGYDLRSRGLQPVELVVRQELSLNANQLLQKLQSLGIDSLGLGQKISQRYPKVWSQLEPIWKEIFPQAEIVVEPKIVVRTTGLIKKFFQIKR